MTVPNKTLMLVGSSPILLDLIKKILEREGYSAHCALGIAEAKKYLLDHSPDGVILEDDLPDGMGLDYCRRLRTESAVPIMFLSNLKEEEILAFHAGATDFLKKPYEHNVMTARVTNMLRNRDAVIAAESKIALIEAAPEEPPLPAVTPIKAARPRRAGIKRQMLTAACFALFLIVMSIVNAFNGHPSDLEDFEEEIPLAGFPFQLEEDAKPYTETGQGIQFLGIDDITVPADTAHLTLLLLNPKGNPCYFAFKLILPDTEETLYTSDLVAPGMCIEEITLTRALAKGEYRAIINILAYGLDDLSAMSGANLEFTLTAD